MANPEQVRKFIMDVEAWLAARVMAGSPPRLAKRKLLVAELCELIGRISAEIGWRGPKVRAEKLMELPFTPPRSKSRRRAIAIAAVVFGVMPATIRHLLRTTP